MAILVLMVGMLLMLGANAGGMVVWGVAACLAAVAVILFICAVILRR